MIDESFAIGNSYIHRLDPAVKIVFATLFSIIVALLTGFESLLSALLISIILIFMARLNFLEVAKRLTVFLGFLLLLWIVLPLTFEGDPLVGIGLFQVTRPGVVFSAQITIRAITILFVFITLVSTMTFATAGQALDRLRVPTKIVQLLMMCYRYIFVIEEEYLRLIRAASIRGFRPGTNMHTYKTYAYIIGMLFVRTVVRAERVNQAMRCRGFTGRFHSLHHFSISGKDWIFSAVMTSLLTCLILLEWLKQG